MLTFRKDRWQGNGWPSIDIDPAEARYFPRLLAHLIATYGAAPTSVVETLDGYIADLTLLGTEVQVLLDTWTFSFAMPDESVRDRLLAELEQLPAEYFEDAASFSSDCFEAKFRRLAD
ncbi:hypothetical protein [Roseimicrobium gellanilyticum]|nr:hypothetical protein [Roseimicrobium gellanilyticum]